MNRFDYVQLNIPLDSIKNPNYDILGKTVDVDGTTRYSLKKGKAIISNHDFRIVLNIDREVTIGFSAKLLGADYRKLIGIDNIGHCFDLLSSKYGLFESVDIEMALRWGQCNRLEVTRDIPIKLESDHYLKLNNLIADTHKWRLLAKDGRGYKTSFGVMRTNNSESVIIYDKEEEMASKNKEYVTEYKDSFQGLTRVEMKFNSKKAIRKQFGSVDLIKVLDSKEKILLNTFSDLFEHVEGSDIVRSVSIKNQRDRERLAYAKEFDCNIGLISQDLRKRTGKNWKRELKPILNIINSQGLDFQETMKLIESIKTLLKNS